MKKQVLFFSTAVMLTAQDPGEIELIDDEIVLDPTAVEQAPENALDKMPVQTGFVDAVYPDSLQKAGVEGVVRLNLLVNETGAVESTTVIGGINPVLDSSALEASKKFIFTPAEAGGNPVAVYIEYEYKFSIDEVVSKLDEFVNCQGELREKGTRTPLADVQVAAVFVGKEYSGLNVPLDRYLAKIGEFEGQTLDNGILVTTTDSLGRFSFKSLPAGQILLRIPQTGYEILETRETINPGEQIDLKLWLNKLSYTDYTVTSYYTGEEKEVSRRQITVNEIKKVAGLGGDAVKVVQAMPGVARPSFASGEVVIRGAYTYDSKFSLDGINIPLLYHFGGLKSTYNADGLGSLDFYPGGFGTSYGNAIGGVVDLKSKNPAQDRYHGKLDLSTLDGSARIEGPIYKDKLSFMATARRSHFGELLQVVQDKVEESRGENFGTTIVPFYRDLTARIDVTPTKDQRISTTYFGSYDSLGVLFEDTNLGSDELGGETNSVKQRLSFHLAGTTYEANFAERFKNRLSLFYTNQVFNTAVFGFFSQKLRSDGVQFSDNLAFKLNDKMTINTGFDGYAGNIDLVLHINNDEAIIKDTTTNWEYANLGGYANLEWQPNDRLQLIPGIRYDYYHHLDYDGGVLPEFANYGSWNHKRFAADPSFRLNGRFKLNDNHLVKGAIGNYNQEPQPQGQVTHPRWGNPKLLSTKAAHYVTGYEWKITDLIALDIQGYFNSQWDIPRQATGDDIKRDGFDAPKFYDDGKGRTFGMELMLRHYQGERFFGWLAYTLARSERWDPKSNDWALFEKDQTHNIQLVGSFKLRKNWELGGRLRYVTGNPTTPIVNNKPESVDYHSIEPIFGEKNSDRLDPFFQFDFRVEKKFILKRAIMTAYADIQNAGYPIYKSPESPDWDDFYIEQKFFTMPIIPAIGMSVEF